MQKLANLIQSELKEQQICAVYNSELARVWPRSMSIGKRMEQIKRFAKQHELAVTFYDVGLCAIFEKTEAPATGGKRMLLLEADHNIMPARKRRRT